MKKPFTEVWGRSQDHPVEKPPEMSSGGRLSTLLPPPGLEELGPCLGLSESCGLGKEGTGQKRRPDHFCQTEAPCEESGVINTAASPSLPPSLAATSL